VTPPIPPTQYYENGKSQPEKEHRTSLNYTIMKRITIVVVLLWWFAVAATAFVPSSTPAVATKTRSSVYNNKAAKSIVKPNLVLDATRQEHESYNQNDDKTLWERIKSLVPSFKDAPTRKAELDRRRHRQEIEKEAKEAFRGAPFPFGMMGKAIASQVGKTFRKEGRKLDKVLNQAQRLIKNDERAVAALGEPVVVGNEFSQSSSTIIVNGKKTERVEAAFEVLGSRQNGIGTLIVEKNRLVALKVSVGGRSFFIDTQ